MQKVLVALLAAGLAVGAAVCPPPSAPEALELSMHGRFRALPNAVVGVAIVQKDGGVGFGNAVLVDAKLGLFVTAAHVAEDATDLYILLPGTSLENSIVALRGWGEAGPDIAVIQVADPKRVARLVPLRIASGPPVLDQRLYVNTYHVHPGQSTKGIVMHGQIKPFIVSHPASDACLGRATCSTRDAILALRDAGEALTTEELRFIYPKAIYAAHVDPRIAYGLVPGMSGSPLLDAGGVIVGITSAKFDVFGKIGRFAPAYTAKALLEKARAEIMAQAQRYKK